MHAIAKFHGGLDRRIELFATWRENGNFVIITRNERNKSPRRVKLSHFPFLPPACPSRPADPCMPVLGNGCARAAAKFETRERGTKLFPDPSRIIVRRGDRATIKNEAPREKLRFCSPAPPRFREAFRAALSGNEGATRRDARLEGFRESPHQGRCIHRVIHTADTAEHPLRSGR